MWILGAIFTIGGPAIFFTSAGVRRTDILQPYLGLTMFFFGVLLVVLDFVVGDWRRIGGFLGGVIAFGVAGVIAGCLTDPALRIIWRIRER